MTKWQKDNPDKMRAYARESARRARERNPEKVNAAQREWHKHNPEKSREITKRRHLKTKRYMRNWWLLRLYGITLEDYERMYAEQAGKCKVCGEWRTSEGQQGLHVDHCHKTGQIRSLLCPQCNSAIGYLKDSVDKLTRLAAYLESFNSVK